MIKIVLVTKLQPRYATYLRSERVFWIFISKKIILCGFALIIGFFRAWRPASVINPRCSRLRQRFLFRSVQWLPLRRGDSRCASRPSGNRFTVESIHPKHNASSTTSTYGITLQGGFLLRDVTTQHSLQVLWLDSNHSLNWAREVKSNRRVISIWKLISMIIFCKPFLCQRCELLRGPPSIITICLSLQWLNKKSGSRCQLPDDKTIWVINICQSRWVPR